MSNKLYVGNLPFSMNEGSLSDTFSAFGTVDSAKIITDRETGRGKGFGFVEMSTNEEATRAIDAMNGKEVEGRALTVNEARPKVTRFENSGGGNGGRRDEGFGNRSAGYRGSY